MNYETLTFALEDGVGVITLNRPDAANAINLKMAEEMCVLATECDENPDVRAIVLTATGKMFCAGGDLGSFAASGGDVPLLLKRMTTSLHAAISRFARGDAPVIGAINGTAAGGGFSLALCTDLAIASSEAKFTMAYSAAGLSPDASSSYFLPRLIGTRRSAELMITNRRLSAEEALQWGLVNQVVAPDDLMPTTMALAKQLASGPTKSYGMIKKLLVQTFGESLEAQMEIEGRGISDIARTADAQEGIAAFLEKRKPAFTGK